MKRRIIIGLLIATLAFSQSGCTLESEVAQTSVKEMYDEGMYDEGMYDEDMYEFIDPDTGVHYWVFSHRAGEGGITPRLNSDGTIMVD